jgi:hypothetical protein
MAVSPPNNLGKQQSHSSINFAVQAKEKRYRREKKKETIPTNHHSDTNDTLRNLQLLSPLHSSTSRETSSSGFSLA